MQKTNVRAREDPHSLSPIQLEGASFDQEIARIKGGRGLRLTLTLLSLAAAVVGGSQLLRAMDTQQAYVQAAAQLEHIDAEQSEAFLRCALPNLQRSQIDTVSSLHNAIEIATERMDKNYGKLLVRCSPLLESFEHALDRIQAPADMTRRLQALSKSAGDLGGAWTNYRVYLQQPGQPYDYVQAAPLIEKITTAWQGYQAARTQAKRAFLARR